LTHSGRGRTKVERIGAAARPSLQEASMTTFRRSVLALAALAALASCAFTGCASQSDYGYGPAAAGFYDECDDGYCVGYPYGYPYVYIRTPGAARTQRLPVNVAKHPPAPRSVPRGTASVPMPRLAATAGAHVSAHASAGSVARR
jgi:hypothetical protein